MPCYDGMMTGDVEARGGMRSNKSVVTAAMAVVILIVVAGALLTGPVLDEFWTLRLTDTSRGIGKLVTEGWMSFTRPPIFNAWATLLSGAGFTSIPLARVVTNLPALGVALFASRRLLDRLPQQARYHAVLMLLVLSAGPTIKAFATYRSDFWQLMAFTTLIMITRHIFFVGEDFRRRKDGVIALLAVVAILSSMLLDYIAGLCGVVLTVATILACMANGLRRWARLLTMTLVAGGLCVGLIAHLQSGYWMASLNESWIHLESAATSAIMTMFVIGALLHNPVALVGGWLERHGWDGRETAFLATIGGTVIISLLLLVEIDAQKNIITTDNAADIALLICAMMAVFGMRLFKRRKWVIGMAGYAVFSAMLGLALLGAQKNWQANAKTIRRTVATCPTTKVYSASGWVMQDGARSPLAAREKPVFLLGYKELSNAYGFKAQPIGDAPVRAVAPGVCPTLLWIEQVPPALHLRPVEVLDDARLTGLDQAKLSIIRSETGLIVRADPR